MRERAPKIHRGPVPRNKEDDQVVYIDSDSAPRIIFSGEDLLLEDLQPGMRVTIAVDDISLPLPPMVLPDVRQTIIEILLEQLDANGVDDVHIIVANCLHRKMTEPEMRRMVGK